MCPALQPRHPNHLNPESFEGPKNPKALNLQTLNPKSLNLQNPKKSKAAAARRTIEEPLLAERASERLARRYKARAWGRAAAI